MQVFILQTPVNPYDPSRGLDEREVYLPRVVLEKQYSFSEITEEKPCDGCSTTRWRIKPVGSNPAVYAYSWPKPVEEA